MTKPILCLDFDGVIHSYTSGWQGADVIPDDVTPGFFEWMDEAAQHFDIQIFSSRSNQSGGIEAMQAWLVEQRRKWRTAGGTSPIEGGTKATVTFPTEKPPALITIDDRALTFTGDWADFSIERLKKFKPWNKP